MRAVRSPSHFIAAIGARGAASASMRWFGSMAEIAEAGGQVVAIMPDRQNFAAEFKRDAASPFPVLTDMDNGYALSLNWPSGSGRILSACCPRTADLLPEYQGNETWTLPIPATFVVGSGWNCPDPICRSGFPPAHGGRGTRSTR